MFASACIVFCCRQAFQDGRPEMLEDEELDKFPVEYCQIQEKSADSLGFTQATISQHLKAKKPAVITIEAERSSKTACQKCCLSEMK